MGEGPAYAAWSKWAGTPGGGTLDLVRASILAANAHDSQPWLFHIGPDQVNLSGALARNLGSIDPYRREMHLLLVGHSDHAANIEDRLADCVGSCPA
jgi:hypothetical protein